MWAPLYVYNGHRLGIAASIMSIIVYDKLVYMSVFMCMGGRVVVGMYVDGFA